MVPDLHAPNAVSHEAMPVLRLDTIQFKMFMLSHMLIPGPNTVAWEWAVMVAGWSQVPLLAADLQPWQPWQPFPAPDFSWRVVSLWRRGSAGQTKTRRPGAAFTPLAWISPCFMLGHSSPKSQCEAY